MENTGLSPNTIKFRIYRLKHLIKLGANLLEPNTVNSVLLNFKGKPSYKKTYIDTYKAFTTYKKIEWEKPKIIIQNKEPFLPTDEEIKQLISGSGKTTATLLQLLYETGIRIGEATAIQWTDIDFRTKTIRINYPEKGSNPRTLPISNTLIAMLNNLRKRPNNNVFNPQTRTLDSTFQRQRKRISEKLQNPRLKQIHFHTLRHLKATTEYAKTQDTMHVKYIMGHKRLDTTARYIHYTNFQEEEYHCKVATTIEEIKNLVENGFQFVQKVDNANIYRKRK